MEIKSNIQLTSENVEKIFVNCLADTAADAQIVEGVMLKVAFNPAKIAEKRDSIISMLAQLPDAFRSDKGGGYTFLNLCVDKVGNQWTDFHQRCDQLVCLGIAVDAIKFCLPREYWKLMPGGMPYIAVNLGANKTADKEQ